MGSCSKIPIFLNLQIFLKKNKVFELKSKQSHWRLHHIQPCKKIKNKTKYTFFFKTKIFTRKKLVYLELNKIIRTKLSVRKCECFWVLTNGIIRRIHRPTLSQVLQKARKEKLSYDVFHSKKPLKSIWQKKRLTRCNTGLYCNM
jgi:hypothetical protein